MTYLVWIGTTFCCVKTCPGFFRNFPRQSKITIAFTFTFTFTFTYMYIVFCFLCWNHPVVPTLQLQLYRFIDLQVFDVIASFGMHVCGSNIKQQPKKTNHTATNASWFPIVSIRSIQFRRTSVVRSGGRSRTNVGTILGSCTTANTTSLTHLVVCWTATRRTTIGYGTDLDLTVFKNQQLSYD